MSAPSGKSVEKKSEDSLDLWADEVSAYENEDIEQAREPTDSELKSEDILCNYGDNVLLEDSSEAADVVPGPLKPVTDNRLTRVRFFTGKRITVADVLLDLPSGGEPDSDQISELNLKFEKSSLDSSSIAPSRSYSSLNDYLKSLTAKQSGNICHSPKSTHSNVYNGGGENSPSESGPEDT